MGRINKNLKMQMHKAIDDKLRIGQSKYEAKADYRAKCEEQGKAWNPGQAEGIHSIKTADAYRQTANQFSAWCKQKHPEIRNLEQINKGIAYQYLQEKQENGYSAWSISKDMAAINKITDLGLNKREGGLQSRRFEDITRSRGEAQMDSKYNPNNYAKQILMAQSFGCRRESIVGGSYQLKEGVSLYQDKDGNVFCRMIEKGGRYREAPCLAENKEQILSTFNVPAGEPLTKEEFKEQYAGAGDYMFYEYSKNIDNHAFRAEYATSLYWERVENTTSNEMWKGWNKEIVQQVSEALGHNRLEIVQHYLRG